MATTTRIADFDCFCGADCGDWIKQGQPYVKINAGGSYPTAYLHPACVERFRARLRSKLNPTQNVPQHVASAVEVGDWTDEEWQRDFERALRGLPEETVARWRVRFGHMECFKRLGDGVRGRPSARAEDDLHPATTTAAGGGPPALAGSGVPTRSPSVGRLNRLDPQRALDVGDSSRSSSPRKAAL